MLRGLISKTWSGILSWFRLNGPTLLVWFGLLLLSAGALWSTLASDATQLIVARGSMGVGGVPMMEAPPIDSVTRASKSLVQIGKADGL